MYELERATLKDLTESNCLHFVQGDSVADILDGTPYIGQYNYLMVNDDHSTIYAGRTAELICFYDCIKLNDQWEYNKWDEKIHEFMVGNTVSCPTIAKATIGAFRVLSGQIWVRLDFELISKMQKWVKIEELKP